MGLDFLNSQLQPILKQEELRPTDAFPGSPGL